MSAPAERPDAIPGEFQEYPKWVFPCGDARKGVKVHDADEEAAVLGEEPDEPTSRNTQEQDAPRRKPGRPRKAA